MRIEMTFVLLTKKLQIFRRKLNYKTKKNTKIIHAATNLHNFCICMKQKDDASHGRTLSESGHNARSHKIEPLSQGNELGYNPIVSENGPVVLPLVIEYKLLSLSLDASCCDSLLRDVISFGLCCLGHNVEHNCR